MSGLSSCEAGACFLPGRRSSARRILSLALLLALPLGGTLGLSAQEASGARDTGKAKRLEASVEVRERLELRDDSDLPPADDFQDFLGHRLRLGLRAQIHRRLSLYVQAQDVWIVGTASVKYIHDLATNLHQAYVDWQLGGHPWQFRVGRQVLAYGDERLVGASDWGNVGRSFDAARLRYAEGAWRSDFFWGRVVDVRRRGAPSRAGSQQLFGLYVARAPKASPARTELYGLYFRDGLRTPGEIRNTLEPTRIFTVGFRRVRGPAIGWRYSLENAWQVGYQGPDPQRAVMLIVTGGYAWRGRREPRLGFEYDFASGDNSPADGRSTAFNNLLPTNHRNYGYADLVQLSNIHDFRFTAAARPLWRLGLQVDYHRFLLAAPRGAWKNAGGQVLGFDPTGEAGRDLGQELDLTLRLPLQKHLQFLTGYSVFFPGRFARLTRGSEDTRFGYVQTTIRF
jgi:Alginate export